MRTLHAAKLAVLFLLVTLSTRTACSENRTWLIGTDGDFGDPTRWDGGVPGPDDTATFDTGGNYVVTFDNDPNSLSNPVHNQALNVANASDVTLASGANGPYTYHLTGEGANDVTVTAGVINMGMFNLPLHLMADDDMIVRGNSMLNINFGSHVSVNHLRLGTENSAGSSGSGIVNVDGTNGTSRLDVAGDTTLGALGFDGTLTYRDNAQGDLSTGGTVRVGVNSSGDSGTHGTLQVQTGADIRVGNVLIGTGSLSSGGVNVSGNDASIEHVGASTLTIGNDMQAGSSITGMLTVGGGSYTVGTGKTTVRGRGVISLNGGQFRTSGDVEIASLSNINLIAELEMFNSSFVQDGPTNITVGAATGDASKIEINSSSVFSTGTGTMTINRTGFVDFNGVSMAVNGDFVIDGGMFDRAASAIFTIAPGRTMTVKNGGDALLQSSYAMSPGSTIHVTGNGSLLDVQSTFTISNSELQLTSGGTADLGNLTVGTGITGPFTSGNSGTLRASGLGTTLLSGSTTFGGSNGGAIVSLSDRATATVNGSLMVGIGGFVPTYTDILVESGARLTATDVNVASTGGGMASVVWTVRDAGSSVALNNGGDLILGGSSSSAATLNVLDGAAFSVGSGAATQLHPTGTINIDGGIVDLKFLNQNGGKINFTRGSLSYTGALNIGAGGLLGTNLTLGPTKWLTMNGATAVKPGSLLLLNDGARFATNAVENAGEIRVEGLSVEFSAMSVNNSGMIRGTGRVNGIMQNTPWGEIRVGVGQQLQFLGTSFINAGDVVAIGAPGAPAELSVTGAATNLDGTGLIVGRDAILSFNAVLDNAGALALNLGTNDVFGDINNTGSIIVTGGSTATFYDDVTQNGTLTVSKVGANTSVAVFLGDFTGSGGSSGGADIFFEGDLRPGNSPTAVTYANNIYFGGGMQLNVEIGGESAGTEHDKITVDGSLILDGTLAVSLIDDFAPTAGDSFDILDWTSLAGAFDTLLLPSLNGPLGWDTSNLYTQGVLAVVAVELPGDFNVDGGVDAADYVTGRKNAGPGQTYDMWRANFGEASSGSGAGNLPGTGVPEPTGAVLILISVALLTSGRRHIVVVSGG